MVQFEEFYLKFVHSNSDQDIEDLKNALSTQNYSFINEWIIHLEKELKWVDEAGFNRMKGMLDQAEKLLPNPEKNSPLWKGLWIELKELLHFKQTVYNKIPEGDRSGEWQITIQNPMTTDGLTSHIHLSFPEAAFLYAKFRKNLGTHEWISMQKVQTFLTENGEKRPSL